MIPQDIDENSLTWDFHWNSRQIIFEFQVLQRIDIPMTNKTESRWLVTMDSPHKGPVMVIAQSYVVHDSQRIRIKTRGIWGIW